MTGGERDSRRLQCELCQGSIAAKLAPAPYTVLVRDNEGRRILCITLIRLAYRIFLCRRLFMRFAFSI